MDPGNIDIQSKFVQALRTQGKAEYPLSGARPCPYPGHIGRVFPSVDQLYEHAKAEHAALKALLKPPQVREKLRYEALKLRQKYPLSDDKISMPGSTSHPVTEAYVIPSVLEYSHHADAVGDYCAKKNFISEAYAYRLGTSINRMHVQSVLTGSGRMVKTVGSATARFSFLRDHEVYALNFEVLSDCIHDLIPGKSFLKATRTFSSMANRARRVINRVANKFTGTRHDVLFLGDSGPRFSGMLNGQHQKALADSGCRVLLMDEDYAEQLGLPILRDNGNRVKLVFADNSTAISSGVVKGVSWSFGTNEQEQEKVHSLDFHVLKNAPAPVILSDKLLFETDAYSKYACYLEDEDDEEDTAYFLAIDIDSSYRHEGASFKANDQYIELV